MPGWGSRRCTGICPPSKPPSLPPPERPLWRLLPLVEVLTCPEPGPRPTRLRDFVAPGAGRRSLSFMAHLQHVRHGGDHAADRRRVLVRDGLVHAAKPERLHRRFLLGRQTDDRPRQRDLKLLAV